MSFIHSYTPQLKELVTTIRCAGLLLLLMMKMV